MIHSSKKVFPEIINGSEVLLTTYIHLVCFKNCSDPLEGNIFVFKTVLVQTVLDLQSGIG